MPVVIGEVSRHVRDHGDGIRIGEVTLNGPDGLPFHRKYLHTPDVVAIVARYGDALVLVREFRAAVGADVLQVPMGKLPDGVDPLVQAVAELREETGFAAGSCRLVGTLLACPGWLNQRMHVFVADDLRPLTDRVGGDPDDIEERHSTVVLLPLTELAAAIRTGAIDDARTIAAVHLTDLKKGAEVSRSDQ